MTYTSGQTVYIIGNRGRVTKTTIISVGRKWARLANRERFDVNGGQMEDGWTVCTADEFAQRS